MKFLFLLSIFFLLSPAVQASYDIYVDKDNQTGTEDGTEASPFDTISEGIAEAMQNVAGERKIWVAEGEYREQVDLGENVELFGAGDQKTIILGKNSSGNHWAWAVRMADETKIKDVGIQYGKQGVLVSSGADVEISNCRIYGSKENGVYVEKAKNQREKFVLKDSKIYDSDKRGLYIFKKRVRIENNEIHDNEEEGIDLKSRVNGTIKDNEIFENGEGGLEMELRNVDLKVKNNKIYSNTASGVNFLYRGKNSSGEVALISNEINKNKNYGLRCGLPAGGRPGAKYFSSAITFSKNEIKKNKRGSYSDFCNF